MLTSKLSPALDGRLAELARRRGVRKSVVVREAIEAKIAAEAVAPRRPANLIEALGDSIGSGASGKRDLALSELYFVTQNLPEVKIRSESWLADGRLELPFTVRDHHSPSMN